MHTASMLWMFILYNMQRLQFHLLFEIEFNSKNSQVLYYILFPVVPGHSKSVSKKAFTCLLFIQWAKATQKNC